MSYNQQTPPPYYGGGNNYNGYHASQAEVVQTTSSVMKRVYFKMFLGLLVTAFISLFCANSMSFMSFVATNSWFYWGLFIAELALVFVLSARVMKMSSAAATLMFLELIVTLHEVIDIVGNECRAIALSCSLNSRREISQSLDKGYLTLSGGNVAVVTDLHAFFFSFAKNRADSGVGILYERAGIAVEVN